MHGDLDVSQIDKLPPGRQKIQTTLLTRQQRPQAYDLMRREIAQGRQVYVVLPLVEESEKLDLRSRFARASRYQGQVLGTKQSGVFVITVLFIDLLY